MINFGQEWEARLRKEKRGQSLASLISGLIRSHLSPVLWGYHVPASADQRLGQGQRALSEFRSQECCQLFNWGDKGWCPWKAAVPNRGYKRLSPSALPASGSEEPWPRRCCCRRGRVPGYRPPLTQVKPHRTVTAVSRVPSVLALQPPQLDIGDEKTV